MAISRKDRYEIRCTESTNGCNFFVIYLLWTVGARLSQGCGRHSCTISDHVLAKRHRSPASNKEFLARYLKEHIETGLHSPKSAMNIVKEKLGCDVPQSTMVDALALAISRLSYDADKGYNHLQAYSEKINSEGGHSKLETVAFEILDNDNSDIDDHAVNAITTNMRFHRLYVTLRIQKEVGEYASFISMDAAHLKGPHKGMLMAATTQDSNNEIFLLGQAIVPNENYENWKFFFQNLLVAYPSLPIKLFSISDRDKGLKKAWAEIVPSVPHSKCLRHLSENFKKKFHNQDQTDILKSMAMAYKKEDSESLFNFLKEQERGIEIEKWIYDAEPELWVRSKFSAMRLGITNSNSIEIFFNAIGPLRYLPTLDLVLQLEIYVCSNKYKKMSSSLQLDDNEVVPKVCCSCNID